MAILDYSAGLSRGGLGSLSRQIGVAQGLQGLQANRQQLEQNQAAFEQQQEDRFLQQQRDRELELKMLEAQGLMEAQDTEGLAKLSIQYPEIANRVLQAKGLTDTAAKQRVSDRFASVYTSANPKETLMQEIARGRAAGLDMSDSEQVLASNLSDDEIRQRAAMSLAAIDPARQQAISGAMTGASGSTPASVREFEYVQSLSPEDRELYFKTQRGETTTPEQRFAEEQRKGELKIKQEQTKEERKLGVKDLRDIADRSRSASSQLSTLNRIGQINELALSGNLANERLALLKMGQSLGLDIEGVSESEMLRAISNDLVLSKSQQMSGALSNADMEFLANTAPQLNQSVGGRAKLIEYGRALAEREKEYAKAAQRFRKENGYFNLSQFNQEFDADNKPLFATEEQVSTPANVETLTTPSGIQFTVEG